MHTKDAAKDGDWFWLSRLRDWDSVWVATAGIKVVKEVDNSSKGATTELSPIGQS